MPTGAKPNRLTARLDIVDVTGPEDFKARLFIDTQTNLPLMLSFVEAEPRVVMRTMTRDGPAASGGPGPVVAPGGSPPPASAATAVGSRPRHRREAADGRAAGRHREA